MLRAHFCVLCGDALPTRGRIDRKYCRPSCRTLAYRRRKQEHRGPESPSAAQTGTDRRAVAAALVVRLEQLTAATQQELAVARLQLAQLAVPWPAPGGASGRLQSAAPPPDVQPLTQMLHAVTAVTAQVQQLRTEVEHWKATATKVASPPVKTEGPARQGPTLAEAVHGAPPSGPAAPGSPSDAGAGSVPPKMPAAPFAAQQPAGTTAASAPASSAAPRPSAPAAQQRPSAPPPSPPRSAAATPAPPRSVAPPAPRPPPAAHPGSRSARVRADLHSERLLDRALAATHRRLLSSGVSDRAILLVQRREAAHLFGKQLLLRLRPLLPARDRKAAARTAFADWVVSLYKQHPDKKTGIKTLLAAHRRELWLLTRALMRLLERDTGAAYVDEGAVDQEVEEDLQEGDDDLQEEDEESPEEEDDGLQEEDDDLQEGDDDPQEGDDDLQEGDDDLEQDEDD